jgi:bifunctional DNA-binding transcriptional regulator/antitoxin component of YhaV-PrlF toxin-antitoxin module
LWISAGSDLMMSSEPQRKVVRSLRGGQVTIPVEFRKQLGINEDSLLYMTLEEGELHVKPVEVVAERKGSPWLLELYELYAPTREDILKRGISEEEVNAEIDAAIAEVRAEQRSRK